MPSGGGFFRRLYGHCHLHERPAGLRHRVPGSLADQYPEFRSKSTGYSFSELRELYEQVRDVQYAKYYGNVRAGNLAKDPEMVIKGYQTR